MRRLAQTLLVGGVVYPAGTWEDDIDGTVRRDDVWQADDEADATELRFRVGSELRQVVEYLVECHLAEPDTSVSDLLTEAFEVFGTAEEPGLDADNQVDESGSDADPGTPADGGSDGSDPDGDAGPARIDGDYQAYTATALKAEIDARNGDTDPDAEGFIKPAGRSKDAYVDALTTHDATTSGA